MLATQRYQARECLLPVSTAFLKEIPQIELWLYLLAMRQANIQRSQFYWIMTYSLANTKSKKPPEKTRKIQFTSWDYHYNKLE
jgi:hypothetical protein